MTHLDRAKINFPELGRTLTKFLEDISGGADFDHCMKLIEKFQEQALLVKGNMEDAAVQQPVSWPPGMPDWAVCVAWNQSQWYWFGPPAGGPKTVARQTTARYQL